MIKRTMQEIADFFDCYVTKDTRGVVTFFKNKPILQMRPNFDPSVIPYWVGQKGEKEGYTFETDTLDVRGQGALISPDLCSDRAEHDIRVLVEPHKEAQ